MTFDAPSAEDPIVLLQQWLDLATKTEPNDPNAVALATSTPDGHPSVRMVLVKNIDHHGLTFYTNDQSQKGTELLANPHAALCFHWKSQRRQIRVEGTVIGVSASDSDEYFHSRSRRSQIGAVASQQSRPLATREQLESTAAAIDAQYPGEIPRPTYWRGFLIAPQKIEFWQDGPDRLHDRILFTTKSNGWNKIRLYP